MKEYWKIIIDRNKNKLKIGVVAIVVTVGVIGIAIMGSHVKEEDQTEQAVKKYVETAVEAADKTGPRYQPEPSAQTKIMQNFQEYPSWIIEYLQGHKEAIDWVADYPEEIQQDQQVIDEKALRPIQLGSYYSDNGIPLLFQWDKKWGYASYGDGVIAVEGCGPTCLSMVVIGLTSDTSMTPKMIADYSLDKGYYTEETGTDWNLMSEGAAGLGVYSVQINEWSGKKIKDELAAGHPMICSMGPGDFTVEGHFIVLTGVDEDGNIIVHDPNSKINSQKGWEVNTLLDQMKGMWAFSV